MLIIARTDARQSLGFDEAHERLKEAVKIGADVAFLEAMQSPDECRRVCQLMGDTPVLLNSVAGGVTPSMSRDEARDVGFRIQIHPGLCLGPVIQAVQEELAFLEKTGKPQESSDRAGKVKDAFLLCGLKECMDLDAAAGGKAYSTLNGSSS